MPPAKKQKTGKKSSTPTKEAEKEDSQTHKNDSARFSPEPEDHDFICIHRPHFDYELELKENDGDGDELFEIYDAAFEEETKSGIIKTPPSEHKNHKWVMLWKGLKLFADMQEEASYRHPDNFNMYICNDWAGWGYIEVLENRVAALDLAIRGTKTKPKNLKEAWANISALGMWFNETNVGPFIGCEDSDTVKEVTALLGNGLLTALAAIESEGQMKSDSEFLDLEIVISSWLYFSVDFERYGIKDDSVDWRPHAVKYFERAKLDVAKGITGTKKLLADAGKQKSNTKPKVGDNPWDWATRFKRYKKKRDNRLGGTKYDITKFSRQERAKYAFDGVDPLKDIPLKDIREGNLAFE